MNSGSVSQVQVQVQMPNWMTFDIPFFDTPKSVYEGQKLEADVWFGAGDYIEACNQKFKKECLRACHRCRTWKSFGDYHDEDAHHCVDCEAKILKEARLRGMTSQNSVVDETKNYLFKAMYPAINVVADPLCPPGKMYVSHLANAVYRMDWAGMQNQPAPTTAPQSSQTTTKGRSRGRGR